jgi:hypothetical protein
VKEYKNSYPLTPSVPILKMTDTDVTIPASLQNLGRVECAVAEGLITTYDGNPLGWRAHGRNAMHEDRQITRN